MSRVELAGNAVPRRSLSSVMSFKERSSATVPLKAKKLYVSRLPAARCELPSPQSIRATLLDPMRDARRACIASSASRWSSVDVML